MLTSTMSSKVKLQSKLVEVVIFNFLLLVCAHCELFTSMVSMESLLATEKTFLRPLKRLIKAENERFANWKTFVKQVDHLHKYVKKNGESKYLDNPVNSYLLLHRMNFKWKQLQKNMQATTPETKGSFIHSFVHQFFYSSVLQFYFIYCSYHPFVSVLQSRFGNTQFPSMKDLKGAMNALLRLQNTYKIPSSELAKGMLSCFLDFSFSAFYSYYNGLTNMEIPSCSLNAGRTNGENSLFSGRCN